ncbi:hypothetical protein LOTGIDRAFT_183373, partial [Lottia gigantea]
MAASLGRIRHLCIKHCVARSLSANLKDSHVFLCSRKGFYTCSQVWSGDVENKPVKAEKISKAMKSYMERAKAYNDFMQNEIEEYELGKRHLANIMGEDPDNFTQADVDKAIAYLLPSGLFDKKARPIFKHPYEIFPARRASQFGMDGRPHHYLFYTGKPQFFEILHNISAKHTELTEVEMTERGKVTEKKLNPARFQKLTKTALETLTNETISPQHYLNFCILMDRLITHPLARRAEEFIVKYSKKLDLGSQAVHRITPEKDENGREYIRADGKRKSSRATVTVYDQGQGDISVNGQDLTYFSSMQDRNQLLFPLQVVDKIGQVDISCQVKDGGLAGQAGAIRIALAKALCSFVSDEDIGKLRLAGLLTPDPRTKERKKTSQPKARKKVPWKRR